jgi:hypothetical protein
VSALLKAAAVIVCGIGIWWSCLFMRADDLFRADTIAGLREAIRLVPDQPAYYVRLAQLDRERSEPLLEKALSLNRYDSRAAIDLGLLREAAGDYAAAEKLFLRAFEADRTFLPRWTLVNYYFRRDNIPAFWTWARITAEMPSDDITPLFQLCRRVTSDSKTVEQRVITADPAVIRQYVEFLVQGNDLVAAASLAPRLLRYGKPENDVTALLALIDKLISAGDFGAAVEVWSALAGAHWIAEDRSLPYNSTFSRRPLQAGFDWRLPSQEGLNATPGEAGLNVEFSGKEPESCAIAEQVLPLQPGEHELLYRYRTAGIPAGVGLHWQIADAMSGAVLAASGDLSSETFRQDSFVFHVPDSTRFVRLRLDYQRAIGTPRISGVLVVVSTKLERRQPS